MPIEKCPAHPLPPNYVPTGGKPYKVKTDEDLGSIARANGLTEEQLVMFNFGTRVPAEINWYLRRNVGCVRTTHDHKNWVFTSEARPGVIYLPPAWHRAAAIAPKPAAAKPEVLNDVWAGLGKAHSGDLFVIGMHDLTAKVYNLGDEYPHIRNAVININGYKFGPGLGADVSAVLVVADGYREPRDMIGVKGEWDLDVALVGKWGDALKEIRGLGKVIDCMEKFDKMKNIVKTAIDAKNKKLGEPDISTIPIPLAGIGLHLWAGFEFGDISLFSTGFGIP